MVSSEHEVPLELIRDSPSVIVEFLAGLGLKPPEFSEIRVDAAELNETMVTEHHSDTVVLFFRDGVVVFAVVLEVQLCWKPAKIYDWFPYVANLWARRRCPTVLVVFVPDAATGVKCGRPIEIGHPGLVLKPLIIGPDLIPVVTDPQAARRAPELAVFSAAAHGGGPQGIAVLKAMFEASDVMEPSKAALYHEYVAGLLPAAARRELEALLSAGTYERHTQFARTHFADGKAEGKAEGEAVGKAEAILLILRSRGVDVPDDALERVTGCSDLTQLDSWIVRAAGASAIDDLFAR